MFQIKELQVFYGGAEILKGISMDVHQGEIVALIGSNGAGKTTTMRAVSGLKPITGGEIQFTGRRIDGMPSQDIVRLGISQVPEGRGLFPYMSVSENLRIGAYIRKDAGDIRNDLNKIFQSFPILKTRSRQQAGTLSGGEQQMLAIACAIMARPTLLLLDEPSTGLSPLMVTEIGRIITSIHEEGTSVLLVEQNAHMALGLAHRGYALETGTIVLSGDTKDLRKSDHVKKAYLGH